MKKSLLKCWVHENVMKDIDKLKGDATRAAAIRTLLNFGIAKAEKMKDISLARSILRDEKALKS